jgi:hypothetical protein
MGTPGLENDPCDADTGSAEEGDFSCAVDELRLDLLTTTDVTASTADFDMSCDSPVSGADEGLSFTAPAEACYDFTLASTGWATAFGIYSECGGEELACNASTDYVLDTDIWSYAYSGSTHQVSMMEGETVLAVVSEWTGLPASWTSDSFDITVTESLALPAAMADIGMAVGDGVATGNTADGADVYLPSCRSAVVPDSTIAWTAPESGCFQFDTWDSSFDTTLTVLGSVDGCVSELACEDDEYFDADVYYSFTSAVRVDVTAGDEYIVSISGYSGTGEYSLGIEMLEAADCE